MPLGGQRIEAGQPADREDAPAAQPVLLPAEADGESPADAGGAWGAVKGALLGLCGLFALRPDGRKRRDTER